jgi:adenine-specific DNA-methyltransferase
MAVVQSEQKLRGGYYTPRSVSEFLARWAIDAADTSVLEPSCGDGNISIAAAERLIHLGVSTAQVAELLTSVELDPDESDKAAARLRALGVGIGSSPVTTSDFFSYCQDMLLTGKRFDVAIGNPPFIRYQHFDERYRQVAFHIMRAAGLVPTRLTNIWMPFVIAATLLLHERGKLAMVIPAELLQVGYAAQLRKFLTDHYASITIVTFQKLLFDDAQQEVVLLLASKRANGRGGIDVVELDDDNQLATYDFRRHDVMDLKSVEHTTEKWTQYYLAESEIQLLRRLSHDTAIGKFGDVASVDVGLVTGKNDFFVLDWKAIQDRKLDGYTIPIVGRTVQTPGLVYGSTDLTRDREMNARCFLFLPADAPLDDQPIVVQDYLAHGVREEVPLGYKCRIRKSWFIVPSIWIPEAFLFRQIHRYPKLVLNETQATTTDTIHRVRFKDPQQVRPTVAAFHNSMTFAFSEVMGRSYGGGVLELEPNEADHLPLPPLNAGSVDVQKLDCLARAGRIEEILELTDAAYLRKGLGLSSSDVDGLRSIWMKLSTRRMSRKFKRREKSLIAEASTVGAS